MTDSNAKNGDTKSSSSRLSLPALPGAEAFQHQTTAWGEQAVDLLTQAQLIQSANGEESPAVSSMIDTPLDMLPELPLEHPRYETRRSERLKVSIANERNRLDRLRIIYAEWDTIYSALALAAKDNCPILARDLRRKCDLTSQGVLGGHFNGPLAWRMVLQHLFGQERTRYDKAFYRNAETDGWEPLLSGEVNPDSRFTRNNVGFTLKKLNQWGTSRPPRKALTIGTISHHETLA